MKSTVKKVTTITPSSKKMVLWHCSECNYQNASRVNLGADGFIGNCSSCNARCRIELDSDGET